MPPASPTAKNQHNTIGSQRNTTAPQTQAEETNTK